MASLHKEVYHDLMRKNIAVIDAPLDHMVLPHIRWETFERIMDDLDGSDDAINGRSAVGDTPVSGRAHSRPRGSV
jgi:hypothetical protein